jgi:hypothetical protein
VQSFRFIPGEVKLPRFKVEWEAARNVQVSISLRGVASNKVLIPIVVSPS